eukprot:IDg5074t1
MESMKVIAAGPAPKFRLACAQTGGVTSRIKTSRADTDAVRKTGPHSYHQLHCSHCTLQLRFGALYVKRRPGAFNNVVVDADVAPANKSMVRLGDVPFDILTALAFLFRDGGSQNLSFQSAKLKAIKTANNVRTYSISCDKDGMPSADLTLAVSLYRTSQIEQPGARKKVLT